MNRGSLSGTLSPVNDAAEAGQKASLLHSLGRGRILCSLLPYVLLALLALLAGVGALALAGITPFGSSSLCWQDNGQQVASDFGYVRGCMEGRHMLSWSYACGGSPRSSFHPTFINLCMPSTWLVAAIPGLSAVVGLSLLFLLQMALLPLGAFYYLRRRFSRLPMPLAMALALAYAFGGFVMSKCSFLPFLHVAMLFPWFVAALEALLRRGRWLPYCLLLSFMLAVGTYYAYMWLLFAAVFAVARTGWRWHSPVQQHTGLLFRASAGALGLSAFFWLPSLLLTAASARAGEAHFWWHATRAEWDANVLHQLLSLPAALFCLMLLPAWRRLRANRYSLALLVVLVGLACVSASSLWHLSRPWDFPGRFGYMADFLFMCMAARLAQAEGIKAPLLRPLVVVCGAFVLGMLLRDSAERHERRYQSSADRILLAEWAAQQVPQPAGRAKSRGFAAVENLAFFTPFDSLCHFTACITREQEETLSRWGYQQRAAVISTEGGTLATDTLLGIRYLLSQEGEGAPFRLEENPYYFGVGLMMPPGVFPQQGEAPITRQQDLLSRLLGVEFAGTRRSLHCQAAPPWEPQPLPDLPADGLHYLQQPAEGSALAYDGSPYGRWPEMEGRPGLCELAPDCRWVTGDGEQGMAELYHLPLASLRELKRYALELPVSCAYAGNRLLIDCRSTEARPLLFLPLLWQEGYVAEVDGAAARVQKLDGFVGISMPEPGEHRVVLIWRRPWMGLSLLISLLSALLLGAAGLASRRACALLAQQPSDLLCHRLLLVVSGLLLLWPLLVLPIGLWWS